MSDMVPFVPDDEEIIKTYKSWELTVGSTIPSSYDKNYHTRIKISHPYQFFYKPGIKISMYNLGGELMSYSGESSHPVSKFWQRLRTYSVFGGQFFYIAFCGFHQTGELNNNGLPVVTGGSSFTLFNTAYSFGSQNYGCFNHLVLALSHWPTKYLAHHIVDLKWNPDKKSGIAPILFKDANGNSENETFPVPFTFNPETGVMDLLRENYPIKEWMFSIRLQVSREYYAHPWYRNVRIAHGHMYPWPLSGGVLETPYEAMWSLVSLEDL